MDLKFGGWILDLNLGLNLGFVLVFWIFRFDIWLGFSFEVWFELEIGFSFSLRIWILGVLFLGFLSLGFGFSFLN